MGKNKKIRKSIESLEKRIKEHERKVEEYDKQNDVLKDYWKKEIKTFKKLKEEKEKKII